MIFKRDDTKAKELLAKIQSMQATIDVLNNEIELSNKTIQSLQRSLQKFKIEPLVEFDIEGMSVYAIERTANNETTIGYKMNIGSKIEALEWTMCCSIKQHNALVKRLKDKIKCPKCQSQVNIL